MLNNDAKKTIQIPHELTVGEFARRASLSVTELIRKLMENGIIAGINETIDFDTASIVAGDLDFEVELAQDESQKEKITLEKLGEILATEKESGKNLKERPPVVTILGHVDHGKTTLLDTLQKTHVAEKESGGITQHIRAYKIEKKGKEITFIDTPGHEAFQSMRQRGASLADIAILVVAADDGVKPQTKEVAQILLENKVPTIVALNKIDKPEADVNRAKQGLAEIGILVEGYGGDIPVVEISAKQNIGLDGLLETILLVAEMDSFQAKRDQHAFGVVLEAHKDPQKGPIATVLIKTGTLKIGQDVIVGDIGGKIRRIENFQKKSVVQAFPSDPVVIIGLSDVPKSNDVLWVQKKEKSKKKNLINRLSAGKRTVKSAVSNDILGNINESLIKKYPVIIKADAQGTLEAIGQILETIPSNEVKMEIISKEVGSITENDIYSAHSAKASVFGFGINPGGNSRQLAKNLGVKIELFSIIYELIEKIKEEMSDLLEPEIKRTDLGKLRVLAVFKNQKKGMVVGGKVLSGEIVKGEKLEITREKEVIGEGKLVQLQQNKEEVKIVKSGYECGLSFEGKEKIAIGDVLISFKEEEIKRKIG